MEISFSKRTLPNGLDVIVHEDHDCPIVGVSVWYHVGSKNETPGHTGFAHLFEHLMFEGSEHHDEGYFRPLQEAGASVNGSTNSDRTNYWEVVPTNALDLALWMESDRMGYLLPALTEAKFQNQRDVVLNERRQNYENRPYGLAGLSIMEALYPPDHPYHWLTIGSPDDLRAASLDDVHAFFRTYYHPANASLALAGQVDTARAFELAERYFGEIPRGPDVGPVTRPLPIVEGEQRLLLEDRVELPRLYLAWHSPRLHEPGDAELDLFAEIFGNGKISRLYRRLVYDRRIATEVGAAQVSRELSSFFQIVATAAPGVGLQQLDDAIRDELQRVLSDGIEEDELRRTQAQTEAHFVHRVQSVGGFGGRTDQLNAYNVFVGDPGYFAQDRERYERVTPAGLQQTVGRHLDWSRRVVLSVVPASRADLALPGAAPVAVR